MITGCYHNGPLILSLPSLGKRVGLNIKEYNFSEAQAGKDICDRKIAPMKAHINRYINEGHDVLSADDMWNALDSYQGVRGCYPAVLTLKEDSDVISNREKLVKWPGITTFSNFIFEGNSIRVWKAYKMGHGELFKMSKFTKSKAGGFEGPTNPTVGPYSVPRVTTGLMSGSAKSSTIQIVCTDASCIKTFTTQEQLTRHISHGKHGYRPQTETKMDIAARYWVGKLTEVTARSVVKESLSHPMPQASSVPSPSPRGVNPEWALRQARVSRRFSPDVKSFLLEEFNRGVDTGKKELPANVVKRLKSKFAKDEWLTAQQVASYFSRLAALQKSGKLLVNVQLNDKPDDDETAITEKVTRRRLLQKIQEQCEL